MPTKPEIKAKVTLDIKPFEAAVEKAGEKAKEFAKETASEFKGMALGGLGAVGVGEFAKGIVEFGTQIQETSERLNLTTDSVQRLRYAFQQGGADSEHFEKGMVTLTQKIAEGQEGNEKAIETFAKLGVTQQDLNDLGTEDVLLKIADAMKHSTSYTESFAAALELLGKKNVAMIPTLREGAEGLQARIQYAWQSRERRQSKE